MSEIMPDATWFGEPMASHEVALSAFERADTSLDVARAAIELCKVGDFSGRQVLLDFVQRSGDDTERIDAQIALLAVADDDMFLNAETTSFLLSASPDMLFQFAGSGLTMLSKSAVPLLLAVVNEFEQIHEISDQAFGSLDSLLDLHGCGISEANFTVQAIADRAKQVVTDVGASYILKGQEFSPVSVAEDMTAAVMRAKHQETRYSNYAPAMWLSIWSGLRCPTFSPRMVGDAEVEALVQYTSTLGRLPWRPGVKYFYGHDVDGGAGLHEVIAQ